MILFVEIKARVGRLAITAQPVTKSLIAFPKRHLIFRDCASRSDTTGFEGWQLSMAHGGESQGFIYSLTSLKGFFNKLSTFPSQSKLVYRIVLRGRVHLRLCIKSSAKHT